MSFYVFICGFLTLFACFQADAGYPWLALFLGFAAGMNCLAAVREMQGQREHAINARRVPPEAP